VTGPLASGCRPAVRFISPAGMASLYPPPTDIQADVSRGVNQSLSYVNNPRLEVILRHAGSTWSRAALRHEYQPQIRPMNARIR
jgi:hypothetical protein